MAQLELSDTAKQPAKVSPIGAGVGAILLSAVGAFAIRENALWLELLVTAFFMFFLLLGTMVIYASPLLSRDGKALFFLGYVAHGVAMVVSVIAWFHLAVASYQSGRVALITIILLYMTSTFFASLATNDSTLQSGNPMGQIWAAVVTLAGLACVLEVHNYIGFLLLFSGGVALLMVAWEVGHHSGARLIFYRVIRLGSTVAELVLLILLAQAARHIGGYGHTIDRLVEARIAMLLLSNAGTSVVARCLEGYRKMAVSSRRRSWS